MDLGALTCMSVVDHTPGPTCVCVARKREVPHRLVQLGVSPRDIYRALAVTPTSRRVIYPM